MKFLEFSGFIIKSCWFCKEILQKCTDNYITHNIANFWLLTLSRWCRCCVVDCYAALAATLFLDSPTFRKKLMTFICRTKQFKMILILPYKTPGLYDGADTICNLSVYDWCLVGGFQRFGPTYYLHLQGNRTKQCIPSVLAKCWTAQ